MLNFSMKTDMGVDATVHRIYSLQCNPDQRGMTVVMAGYVDDKAERPIVTYTVELNGDMYAGNENGVLFADVYTAVSGIVVPPII